MNGSIPGRSIDCVVDLCVCARPERGGGDSGLGGSPIGRQNEYSGRIN
jgi:hypothetical protein